MTRSLRPTLCCAIVGFVAALVVGCGGGGGGSAVSGEPISLRELAQAARSSADATSGRFAFSMDLSFPGAKQPFAFTGEGAFDATSKRASFTLDMSSFASLLGGLFAGAATPAGAPDFGDPDAWQIEAIQDGHVMYLRFPAVAEQLPAGKSWVREDLQAAGKASGIDFGDFQQFTNNDPRAILDFLRAVSGDVETVGAESVRGADTTHYRTTIDPLDYEKLAPPDKREELRSLVQQMVAQSGIGKIPVDIWVDEFGFVRKLTMAFSATQPGTTEAAEASMTFELYDYGADVAIELPPAAQVVDASALRQ